MLVGYGRRRGPVPGCICCGVDAAQFRRRDRYFKHQRSDEDDAPPETKWVECANPSCDKGPQSYTCAMSYCDKVFTQGWIPKTVQETNLWLREMLPYYLGTRKPGDTGVTIPFCIGCSLSALIPDGTKPSLKKLARPTPISGTADHAQSIESDHLNEHSIANLTAAMHAAAIDSGAATEAAGGEEDEDDGSWTVRSAEASLDDDSLSGFDDEYDEPEEGPVYRHSKRKRAIDESRQDMRNLPSLAPGIDTMAFLAKYAATKLKAPSYKRVVSKRSKLARADTAGPLLGGHFVGALYIPSHKVIICTYSDNDNLYIDLHGLAKSLLDKTPHVPHMVLDPEDARELENYWIAEGAGMPYLTKSDFELREVDQTEMPESASKKRTWTVQHATLPQKVLISDVLKDNGRTRVPLEELKEAKILSWRRPPSRDAEQVFVLGSFDMEPNGSKMKGVKLLAARVQKILGHSISDEDVLSMYSNLRAVSGRHGFEMTRTSGTNGYTTPQTHKNFLWVLREHDYYLPNKAGCCLIVPHGKYYWCVYSKHHPDDDEHPISCTAYPPPQPGGSLVLNGNAVDAWPILGEFAYVKMMVTLTLLRLNEIFRTESKPEVAVGPLRHELYNIEYARDTFDITGSYRAFIKAFMSVNSMSLIAWPVGQHNDHFHQKGESLENKITFVLPHHADDRRHGVGRGGSLFGNKFVFALLDWKYETRSWNAFYRMHSEDMGLGPPTRGGGSAKKKLQTYFSSGTQPAQRWERQANRFVTVRANAAGSVLV